MKEIKKEHINREQMKQMEANLNCKFCDDGIYAEMSLNLENYEEGTAPIESVQFRFFDGNIEEIKRLVMTVDEEWPQYFTKDSVIFCGYINGRVASFCLLDSNAVCIISEPEVKVGSIGCVGTIAEHRKQGIGLRMVDLATQFLKNEGCNKAYISYTHIDSWYAKLGYETFARFSFL